MAWHHRHIAPTLPGQPAGGLRINVTFVRRDLLWVPDAPVTDPYTRTQRVVDVPFPKAGTERRSQPIYFGPNVLDLVKKETYEEITEVEDTRPDGTVKTDAYGHPVMKTLRTKKTRLTLREPDEFFEVRKLRGEDHPFKKQFCAGGTYQQYQEGFIEVEKRSSVSISMLVYKLTMGIDGGSFDDASRRIGKLAVEAWERDLERACELYQLVKARGVLELDDVPLELRATATVSQEVEAAILKKACEKYGIDPDKPLRRGRGRPREKRDRDSANRASGSVIELTLHADGAVTGRLIEDFGGLVKGTDLANLTLAKLAELLGLLRQAELGNDADMLEAYLDAADRQWRDKIAEEIQGGARTGPDPWEILGVARGTPPEEITRAYRALMRKVHPDTSKLPDWFARQVNQAYEQLMQEVTHGG